MHHKTHKRGRLMPAVFLGGLLLLAAAVGGTTSAGWSKSPEPAPLSALLPEDPPPVTLEDIQAVSFTDVPDGGSWGDCIRYTACRGIMGGTGEEVFQPEKLVSRAVAVVTLFRMSGEEAPGTYRDVEWEDWYAGALAWAVQADLLDGAQIQAGTFDAQKPITRAQFAGMLVRHAAYMSAKTETNPENAYNGSLLLEDYKDGGSISENDAFYVLEALRYGLFKGMVSDTIYPNLPINRGQAAQMLTVLSALETGEPLAVELAGKLQAKTVTSVAAANHDAIQAKVNEIAAKYGAIGLQAAVLEDGAVTDSFACGWATQKTDPMTADHKMRVASLSKVSVGMAAMILRDRGVVDLDAGIGNYWGFPTGNPHYPNAPVSIRSLLSHTSSIPLYGDDVSRGRSAVESKLRNNRYNNMRPGSVWSWGYNNYGFAVLGMTLELAGHDYLDNILGKNLWDIMDIDAAFEGGEIRAANQLATIYRHDGSVGRSVETQRNYRRPAAPGSSGSSFAGGLTISANDQAKLLGLLINDGTYQGLRLLSEESVALMETRFDQILSDGTYQALPLRSQDNIYGRQRLYYHTGSAYGVYNFMSYDPETGDGIVVLSSGASASKDGNGIYAVCGDIARYFYELTAQTAP